MLVVDREIRRILVGPGGPGRPPWRSVEAFPVCTFLLSVPPGSCPERTHSQNHGHSLQPKPKLDKLHKNTQPTSPKTSNTLIPSSKSVDHHNPKVAGSNPAPATARRRPVSFRASWPFFVLTRLITKQKINSAREGLCALRDATT